MYLTLSPYINNRYTISGIVTPDKSVVIETPPEAMRSLPPYSIATIAAIAAVGIPERMTNTPSNISLVMNCLKMSQIKAGRIISFISATG